VEVAAEDFNGVDLNLGNNRFFDIDIVWGPDLAVTDFKLSPSRPAAGEPVMVDVTVVNQGITKTGTTSPHGEGFFFVEVYAKDADFNPDGPPDGPMDHDGGFWGPLPEGGWGWRTEYINYYSPVAGLEPGEETVVSLIITPTATSPYDFYAQVDVTFDVPISTTHPYGYPWGIHEEGNEYNNIAMYQERDIPPVYLPMVMRN